VGGTVPLVFLGLAAGEQGDTAGAAALIAAGTREQQPSPGSPAARPGK